MQKFGFDRFCSSRNAVRFGQDVQFGVHQGGEADRARTNLVIADGKISIQKQLILDRAKVDRYPPVCIPSRSRL